MLSYFRPNKSLVHIFIYLYFSSILWIVLVSSEFSKYLNEMFLISLHLLLPLCRVGSTRRLLLEQRTQTSPAAAPATA